MANTEVTCLLSMLGEESEFDNRGCSLGTQDASKSNSLSYYLSRFVDMAVAVWLFTFCNRVVSSLKCEHRYRICVTFKICKQPVRK